MKKTKKEEEKEKLTQYGVYLNKDLVLESKKLQEEFSSAHNLSKLLNKLLGDWVEGSRFLLIHFQKDKKENSSK